MDWKNKNGYTITGVIRGNEYKSKAMFIIKTKEGIGWANLNYLDPWNSGNSGHELEGLLTNEDADKVTFKSDENDFNLTIAGIKTDEMQKLFEELIAPKRENKEGLARPYAFDYEGQYQFAYYSFNKKI
jgi:hypothetical protein